MRRAIKRALRGRSLRQSDQKGPWCLLESWGGILEPVAYGTRAACGELRSLWPFESLELRPVCLICDGIQNLSCTCARGDFAND